MRNRGGVRNAVLDPGIKDPATMVHVDGLASGGNISACFGVHSGIRIAKRGRVRYVEVCPSVNGRPRIFVEI
jgi:hypothetical protein